MGSEKVIALLLIIAIVFSVASIVINLSASNYNPSTSVSYKPQPVLSGSATKGISIVVQPPVGGAK